MKIYLHVYTVLKKITFSYSFNHTFNQHIFCFSRFRNGCAREKIKGVKSIGKVQCHVIRYPSAREDSDCFFFGARWLSIKYFPGSWGFCSCLWTLFRWADRLTVLLKSFNLFLHQIVVNVDVFVILFTLVFEHCYVCVVSPNTACGCMHITYKTFQEREERKRMSEWLSNQEILYIYECSICK